MCLTDAQGKSEVAAQIQAQGLNRSGAIQPGFTPILTVLLLSFGWRNMFVIMGVLGIAVAIGWYIVYRNRKDIALEPQEIAHLTEGEPAQRRHLVGERVDRADHPYRLPVRPLRHPL